MSRFTTFTGALLSLVVVTGCKPPAGSAILALATGDSARFSPINLFISVKDRMLTVELPKNAAGGLGPEGWILDVERSDLQGPSEGEFVALDEPLRLVPQLMFVPDADGAVTVDARFAKCGKPEFGPDQGVDLKNGKEPQAIRCPLELTDGSASGSAHATSTKTGSATGTGLGTGTKTATQTGTSSSSSTQTGTNTNTITNDDIIGI